MDPKDFPAFPTEVGSGGDGGFQCGNERWHEPGMTMRDYFAAKAMHALIVDPVFTREVQAKRMQVGETVALSAYAMADAMLAARATHQE